MARPVVADDGSPIVIGDSSSQLQGKPLQKFVTAPHLSLQHQCFHELIVGGLTIQNKGWMAVRVDVLDGGSYPLTAPWFLDLNGLITGGALLSSADSLTVYIQHGDEYDLIAVPVPATAKTPLTALTTLIIGTKDLSSAKLNGTEIIGSPRKGLTIIWKKIQPRRVRARPSPSVG